MNEPYDCTAEVKEHISLVQFWAAHFGRILADRALVHDASKLNNPVEKQMFDTWTPELKTREAGTPEYQEALAQMGVGLQMHYQANSHHPEHYKDGVDGMNLYDVVEMVCDWMVVCEKKGVPVDMGYLQTRFKISPQLRAIIENTFMEVDVETIKGGLPRGPFLKGK